MQVDSIGAIAGMALVTYLARASGFWLVSRVAITGRFAKWMSRIPGSIFAAILAPSAVMGGAADLFATLAVILIMARTQSLLLAMVCGVFAASVLRAIVP